MLAARHDDDDDEKCMIWFGLVGFYGILIIVGYLIPNPFIYSIRLV